jgi:hypothetical protein
VSDAKVPIVVAEEQTVIPRHETQEIRTGRKAHKQGKFVRFLRNSFGSPR